MKRFFLATVLYCALCCFGSFKTHAQNTAIGLRLGSPISASVKLFPGGGSNAVEAFVGYRNRKVNFGTGSFGWTWINVGGLYQIHNELGNSEGLKWYYGGGASAYFWSYDDGFADAGNYGSVSFGIHGNLGLDYTFDNVPVNLSLDWIPTIILGSGYSTGFGAGYGALSVRYVLGRN